MMESSFETCCWLYFNLNVLRFYFPFKRFCECWQIKCKIRYGSVCSHKNTKLKNISWDNYKLTKNSRFYFEKLGVFFRLAISKASISSKHWIKTNNITSSSNNWATAVWSVLGWTNAGTNPISLLDRSVLALQKTSALQPSVNDSCAVLRATRDLTMATSWSCFVISGNLTWLFALAYFANLGVHILHKIW